jgi:hypothetical protein
VGEPKRQPLGAGAAGAAPTAPHATRLAETSPKRRPNGPERFWSARRARIAFAVCLAFSAFAHYAIAPFELPHGFELNDVDGEAAIPVDLLAPDEPPPPEAPSEPTPAPSKADDDKDKEPGAGARADAGSVRDAGAIRDARPQDASDASNASPDGSGRELVDGGANGGFGWDAALALADGGSSAGPRDPEGIVGAAGAVQADVVLVMLVVNAEVIRQHPVGARLGSLVRGIPQWDEFMTGTNLDPVRDADWVIVSGPSLINTSRDVMLIHYSAADSVIDQAIGVVSRKYDRGGVFDAGVPGVKAYLAHADRAERVLLRPQPHVLAVVPPSVAQKVAKQLVGSRVPAHVRPGEAVYLRLVNPHHPAPEIPESLTELRMRVVPRADLGADVFVDGDTKDAEAAKQAADELRRVVRRHDDAFTSMLTHGLLDQVEVSSEGTLVKVHTLVTLDQIETLASLVSAFLGVQPSAPGPTLPSASPPVPSTKRR